MYSVLKPLSKLLFSIALALVVFPIPTVLAQDAGIRISPATIEETVDPGVVRDYELEVENMSATDKEYFVYTRNIRSVSAGGVPIFAESRLEQTGYELADWIDLSTTTITVPAGQTVIISFTMNVPQEAACSHFGGVFVSAEPPDIENSGAAVGYQVANIISIRVAGDCVEEASIRQFSTDRFLYGTQDVSFNVIIENSGSVLVRPTGPLEVYNSLGRRVGNVVFNESRAAVFPGDTREYDAVQWVGDSLGFGRYEAVLSPVYGDDGARKTMSSTVTFWVLPFGIIGPAVAVLALVLLITVVSVRLYIKRALVQMNAGRRVVRNKKNGGPSMFLLLLVSVLIVVALFLLVMLVLFA